MDTFCSPDGIFRVEFQEFEMRMSHLVCNPRVTHVPSGRVVLDLWGTMWDAWPEMEGDGRMRLSLREYPGDKPGYDLVFDPKTGESRREDAKMAME